MNEKITKKENTKEPYTLKVYKGYKKTERKFWKVLKFPNYEKLEEFIRKLFKKKYRITEIREESYIWEDLPSSLWPSDITEMWICNKKERKCYLFEPVTKREDSFFRLLPSYFSKKRKLKPKEIEKLRKKNEELTKKRDILMKKIEQKIKPERQKLLKELKKIDKVIEKMDKGTKKLPRKNSQEL